MPSIYDFHSNQTIDRYQSNDTVHLPTCPPQNEIFTAVEFQLYSDGSVEIIEGGDQSSFLEPGEYCLGHMDESNPTEYFVRFCPHLDDWCYRPGVKCIPKCCPHGMLANDPEALDNRCQITSESFELEEFKDNISLNGSITIISNRLEMSECLSEGSFFTILRPDVNPEGDTFHLLPDGRLYVVGFSEMPPFDFDQFCIDYFTTKNEIVRHIATSI